MHYLLRSWVCEHGGNATECRARDNLDPRRTEEPDRSGTHDRWAGDSTSANDVEGVGTRRRDDSQRVVIAEHTATHHALSSGGEPWDDIRPHELAPKFAFQVGEDVESCRIERGGGHARSFHWWRKIGCYPFTMARISITTNATKMMVAQASRNDVCGLCRAISHPPFLIGGYLDIQSVAALCDSGHLHVPHNPVLVACAARCAR